MENVLLKGTVSFFGSCLAYAVGGADLLFRILVVFLVTDYITGLMKAYVNKELSSVIGCHYPDKSSLLTTVGTGKKAL